MGVSKNNGTPKSSYFNRVFHCKPSILGYPYFWKHPLEFPSGFSQPFSTFYGALKLPNYPTQNLVTLMDQGTSTRASCRGVCDSDWSKLEVWIEFHWTLTAVGWFFPPKIYRLFLWNVFFLSTTKMPSEKIWNKGRFQQYYIIHRCLMLF